MSRNFFQSSFFLVLLASHAWAQPAKSTAIEAGTITLREALARTLAKNPRLAAEAWEARAAEAKELQAALRPNPEAALGVENFLGSGDMRGFRSSQTTLALSQIIELGGKRAARIRAAGAETNVTRLEYETKRLEVLEETAKSFVEVLGAQQRVKQAQALSSLAEELLPLIDQRVKAGKASAVEQARGAATAASSIALIDKARGELAAARRDLAAQWGKTEPDFTEVAGELQDSHKLPELAALREKLNDHPLLTKWNAEEVKREAAVRKEKSEAAPNLTAYVGPRWLQDSRDGALVAGVSIPLPFKNRNQGNIKEAQVKLSQVPDARRAELNELSAKLGGAWEKWRSAQRQIATLQDKVLPTVKTAVQATREAYETGKLSQLDVLEARRSLSEAQDQLLDALIESRKASIQIEVLTGIGCGATTH